MTGVLTTTGAPAILIVTEAEIGEKVAVPDCAAVTAQLPAFKKFKVELVIEQISPVVVENTTPPPLDAVAARVSDLLARFTGVAGVKEIICGSRVTSNETLYRSEARYEELASL